MNTGTGDVAAITNLLYTYAERMDAGDFGGAAELFTHATVTLGNDSHVDATGLQRIWERSVRRYADGTPRTKHVTTNVIVELSDDGAQATARSYYTVFQQTDALPLQAIIAGRYHDTFVRTAEGWQWATRDYSLVDLVGDLSHHLAPGLV